MRSFLICWIFALQVVSHSLFAQTCQDTTVLTSNSGIIEDGSGLGENYSTDLSCTWLIVPANEGVMKFVFNRLSTDPDFDKVSFYGIENGVPNLVQEVSGQEPPGFIMVESDTAMIRFETDDFFQDEGWEIAYESRVSNNAPIFNAQSFSIFEQPAVGALIGNLEITDADDSVFQINVLDGSENGPVTPLSEEVQLVTNNVASYDFEENSSIDVELEVTDGFDTVTNTVTIDLIDIDESLVPSFSEQEFTIYENPLDGTLIGQLIASDAETLYYVIAAGNDEDAYELDELSGELSVVDGSSLDYESDTASFLTVTVYNSSYSNTQEVIVNLINIDCTSGETITTNSGTISDGSGDGKYENGNNCSWLIQPDSSNVRLSFDEIDIEQGFDFVNIYNGNSNASPLLASISDNNFDQNINSTGGVTFIEFITNSSENREGWQLTFSSDLSDNSLAIEDQSFTTFESNKRTVAELQFEELDNDLVFFSILLGNTDSIFTISETGVISIRDSTEAVFDALATPQYNLQVQLTDVLDTLIAEITIGVVFDGDVTAPVIDDQSFQTLENQPEGTIIGEVEAFDSLGIALEYEIISGNGSNDFQMDGNLLVMNQLGLDYESDSTQQLTIEVTNGLIASQAIITVNIEDVGCSNQTLFTEATGSLSDGSDSAYYENNTTCDWVIDPITGGPIELDFSTFNLETEDVLQIFEGVDGSGDLLVSLTGNIADTIFALDADELYLEFTTGSSGSSEGWQLSYTSQNTAPMINDQSFIIEENESRSTLVGSIVAADDQSDELEFSVVSGNEEGSFAINNEGIITVDTDDLNFEETDLYEIVVLVTDGYFNDTANVTIEIADVNDAPTISADTFTIAENSSIGTVIGQISGIDEDGDSFMITNISGEGAENFSFNSNNELLVNFGSLNYEQIDSYSITVQISDGDLTAQANLVVNLIDQNDAPVLESITYQVYENLESTILGALEGTDEDDDALSYTITGGNELGHFAIDTSDQLLLTSALNFEETSSISIDITVSDGDSAVVESVTIEVLDVNDGPVMLDSVYHASEDLEQGSAIGMLAIEDEDGDDITISIIEGNENGVFRITQENNLSLSDISLDFESQDLFELLVTVSDGDLTDTAAINVVVIDVNEAPVVNDDEFVIFEDQEPGESFGALSFSDEDGNALSFSIIEGNTQNAFQINNRGELSVSGDGILEFDDISTYNLEVLVSDGELSDTAAVIVNLVAVTSQPKDLSDQLLIYPNPAREFINIQYYKGAVIDVLEIWTLDGKAISGLSYQSNSDSITHLDVSRLKPGKYYLKVEVDGKYLIKQFLVSRN